MAVSDEEKRVKAAMMRVIRRHFIFKDDGYYTQLFGVISFSLEELHMQKNEHMFLDILFAKFDVLKEALTDRVTERRTKIAKEIRDEVRSIGDI